jgi:hypothetical protein
MVTVIGSVLAIDNEAPGYDTRSFVISTSAYDGPTTGPIQFSVTCFLENTKRWLKVKTPQPGALLSVTAKVAGRTARTNQLALRVLDITYLPRPASAPVTSTPEAISPSKRSCRWEGRAGPFIPSKKLRTADLPDAVERSLVGSDSSISTRYTPSPPSADTILVTPSTPPYPSTDSSYEEPPCLDLTRGTDEDPRPHHARQLPKKYAD